MNKKLVLFLVTGLIIIVTSGCGVNRSNLSGWYERETDSNHERIEFYDLDSTFEYSMSSLVCCQTMIWGKWAIDGNVILLRGIGSYTGDLPQGPFNVEESLDESVIGYRFKFVLDDDLIEAPIRVLLNNDTVPTIATTGVLTVDVPSITRFSVYSDFNTRAYEHDITKYGSNVFVVRFVISKYPCESLSFSYRIKYRRKRLYQLSEDESCFKRAVLSFLGS